MKRSDEKKILAADIGGTNSRFAHFEVSAGEKLSLVDSRWLNTKESSSFGHLIEILSESSFSLRPDEADIAVIAVAGPVEREVYSSPPFISWNIDISKYEKDFGFKRCVLINDFVAQVFACRSPEGEKAEQILSGHRAPGGTVAVIGAGTALGKAALASDGAGGYVAVPSEGGHGDFPFISGRECEFLDFLRREVGEENMSANMVVSGRGLTYVHRFLTGEALKPSEVAARFAPDSESLAWSAHFYGRACRNYALEVVARGGVYIAGGVAARTPELLRHPSFEQEFHRSRTMKELLSKIPVFLITNQESGLWGAALLGKQVLDRADPS